MSQSRPRTHTHTHSEVSKDAVQPFHMKKIQRVSTSSIVEFPTLAINDVNENVNDDDGACPADACTVGTTE